MVLAIALLKPLMAIVMGNVVPGHADAIVESSKELMMQKGNQRRDFIPLSIWKMFGLVFI